MLVTVDFGKGGEWTAEERSRELVQLASSAGAKVVREEIVKRDAPNPAYFVGTGKAEEFAGLCAAERIDVLIFNNDLTGTQQKNLEETARVRVVDRTQVILNIFARRAHSNEGKVQVELAQLMYLLPRLTGKGIALSGQGGGIGTRGPGEQKLEMDRRKIRERITRLKDDLKNLSQRREMMRKKRKKFSLLTVAIIGYTNVGKSTLLNALTNSDVIVRDKLFATLDPTIRKFILPNKQKVLFVDTVGFLNELPHHLIEAFKATLEEMANADLLLHVVDVSHPKQKEQFGAVRKVLEEIEARDIETVTVLNKTDLAAGKGAVEKARAYFNDAVAVSALKKEGLDELIGVILRRIGSLMIPVKIGLPITESRILNLIYENGVVDTKEYSGDLVYIEARVPERVKEMLEGWLL